MATRNSAHPQGARQCRHVKAGGNRCRANARSSSEYCFFHDPESVAERRAARKNGGIERSRKASVLPASTPDRELKSAAAVRELLAETINQVRRGEIDPRISNAVGYLASVLLQANERDELERRLARLESIIAHQAEAGSDFRVGDHLGEIEFVNPESGGRA